MAAGALIKHKRHAGAFVGGDLAAGEFGVDTTNGVIYFSYDDTTVSILSRRDVAQTFSGVQTFSSTIVGSINGNSATATNLQTGRAIYGNNFDGSVALTQVIAPTYGGTNSAFFGVSGPSSSIKTFTFPNASATVLTDNALVTIAQGGTGINSFGTGVATWLSTPSSANLAAAITDETGSGALVFNISPTLTAAILGSSTATTQSPNDNSTKVATTAYVDTAFASFDAKPQVAYASTSALPANTYANGSSGVGATLTGNSNGPLVIDGVTILVSQVGERVLVTGESTAANNGWYSITQQGVVAVSPYILTRTVESDQAAEIGSGYLTSVIAPNGVTAGSSNNGKVFISTAAADPFVVGTTSLTFSAVGGVYTAGNGLTLSGSSFVINTAVTVDLNTAQVLTNKDLSSGTNTFPTFNQSTTGSAATLTTARTIGGVSFNGSVNITVATATGGFTVSGGDLALGANNLTMTGSIGSTGSRITKLWAADLTVTNTISGSITGLAGTATALATARAINGVNFDGTAPITVTAAAGTLSGATLAAGVTASSLTSLGTLTGLTEVVSDAATNATSTGATYGHNSSGTAAAGYGSVYKYQLQDSTTTDIDAGNLTFTWATATHASRKARAVFNVYDTAVREGLRIEASGTAPMIGFLGAGASAALASPDAGTALVTFGLATGTPTFGAANISAGAMNIGTGNTLTCGTIELGAASDTTLSRSSAGVLAVEGVVIPSISSTNTLTNKRVTKRTGTTTSSATPTINTDNVDFYSLTAQTADITSFTTNLSGTPTEAQTLWIAITGTAARAITWGTSFEASTVALPTTTVTTARLDVGFIWNTVTSKWRCVATC